MKVPSLTDFGKSCNELLYGSPKTGGIYQYDNRFKISSKSSDSLSVELTGIRGTNDSPYTNLDVKASLAVGGGCTVETVATSTSKASLKATMTDLFLPGLKGVVSAAYPYKNPTKISLEYGHQHFHVKGSADLKKIPHLELAAAAGVYGAVVGGQITYDTSGQESSKWSIAAGYTTQDNHSVFGYVLQKGKELKMSYAHKLNEQAICGAEVIKPLNRNGDMTVSLGYSTRLASGALAKAKVNSMGICSMLWEGKVEGGAKLALSGQFDANNLKADPRLGCSLDIGK